jgi:hypothetical protein
MDWIQFLILFLTLIGIYLTNRADMRAFEKDSKDSKDRFERDSKEWRERYDRETKEFREKWAEESKDFHGRLISIEERRNKIIFKE